MPTGPAAALPEGLADPELAAWVAEVRREPGEPVGSIGSARLREAARRRAADRPRGPELAVVKDLCTDNGIALRLYRPTLRPAPMVVFLHGGGFVIGDLDTHDGICRHLAADARAAVVAVDHRRAPEHPGPAAVDDAVDAVSWTRAHLVNLGGLSDAGVALAGDSSGGAVAVLAASRLRETETSPSALLLAYPNVDMTLSMPSVEGKGHGWGLDSEGLRWFVDQWLGESGRGDDPRLSPWHADLSGLPPTIIATAEHDPLRDEGDALAARLGELGVPVHHLPHAGLVHGFLGLGHVSPTAALAGHALFARFGDLLRELSGPARGQAATKTASSV
ncbi:MAG TPA: alpha/beta hydrolase [Actinomycetes bacterium]|nr:alpha/beta hydrolase [Actinomycetes bacterium]